MRGCDKTVMTILAVGYSPYNLTIQLVMSRFELPSLSFSLLILLPHFMVLQIQNSPTFPFGIELVQIFSGFHLNGLVSAWIVNAGRVKLENENENVVSGMYIPYPRLSP